MGIFKPKKNDLAAGPDVPIDQVSAMKAQNYSNNQIIQTLQRDGYTSNQIFDAISQFELSSKNAGVTDPQLQQSMPQMPSMSQSNTGGSQPMQQNQGYNPQQMQQMPMMPMTNQASNEEMIEAIIDEKWNDLVKDINKVIEWKQKADSRLTSMEQQITDMKDQFDKLHQAIIGKIGDYDKHMLDVGAELQAMEKVFSKVLPTFFDNVNELSRITDKVRSNSSFSGSAGSTSNNSATQSAGSSKTRMGSRRSDDD